MRLQSMGNTSHGYGFPPQMSRVRPSGYVAEESGGKRIPRLCLGIRGKSSLFLICIVCIGVMQKGTF